MLLEKILLTRLMNEIPVCRTDKNTLLYNVRCRALRAPLGSPFGRAVGDERRRLRGQIGTAYPLRQKSKIFATSPRGRGKAAAPPNSSLSSRYKGHIRGNLVCALCVTAFRTRDCTPHSPLRLFMPVLLSYEQRTMQGGVVCLDDSDAQKEGAIRG